MCYFIMKCQLREITPINYSIGRISLISCFCMLLVFFKRKQVVINQRNRKTMKGEEKYNKNHNDNERNYLIYIHIKRLKPRKW
jgi:hypothetical protein